MSPQQILEKLQPTIRLLEIGNLVDAKKEFKALHLVDTPQQFGLPKSIRHFIWDLYELLILSNEHYITKEEVLDDYYEITKRYLSSYHFL